MARHHKHPEPERIPVKPHHRARPSFKPKAPPPSPMPGQTDFSPDEEQAMRHGRRAQNMAPPMPAGEPDEDDLEGGV